ncbi:hypothetical protein WA026_016356 [Henosepilachna vigintioctopunctata]|uniref:Membrane insertase YidC/Oxa/ALB C-terminal domain-containing protein n=1 Tax=Henosepilachna vigintioctopunctata TaxID=420089 RepID=A0AAW1UCS6_9CUCU
MFHLKPKFSNTIKSIVVPLRTEYFNKVYLCHLVAQKKFNVIQQKFDYQKRTFSQNKEVHLQPLVQPQISDIGIFKTLSESAPVQFLQSSLVEIHSYTGLPWWGTIIFSTVLLRSCTTLPLAVFQQYILAKLELIKYEMNDIVKELKKEISIAAKSYKWDVTTAKSVYNYSFKSQWNKLIVRENCHPFKTTLLLWVQIPLWVSLSVSIRNLIYMQPKMDETAKMIFLQLSTEGVGWIPNLTAMDSTLVLPIAFGIINLGLIELMTLSKVTVPTKFQRITTNLFRGFTIILIPICISLPSGLLVYWTTSSLYGLVQNFVLMSPKVKRFCRIPPTPSELEYPYKQLSAAFKKRFNFLNKDK